MAHDLCPDRPGKREGISAGGRRADIERPLRFDRARQVAWPQFLVGAEPARRQYDRPGGDLILASGDAGDDTVLAG